MLYLVKLRRQRAYVELCTFSKISKISEVHWSVPVIMSGKTIPPFLTVVWGEKHCFRQQDGIQYRNKSGCQNTVLAAAHCEQIRVRVQTGRKPKRTVQNSHAWRLTPLICKLHSKQICCGDKKIIGACLAMTPWLRKGNNCVSRWPLEIAFAQSECVALNKYMLSMSFHCLLFCPALISMSDIAIHCYPLLSSSNCWQSGLWGSWIVSRRHY